MNKKMFKPKGLVALALALLMVMPMLFAAMPATVKADGSTAPQLSVVQDGTTSGLISAMTVGSSFTVDIYINNTQNVVPGINAISYGVAFNPAVLQVTASTDGDINSVPYLGVKQQNLGDLPPDNVNGFVVFGQIIVNSANATQCVTDKNGVVNTVTFQVISTGSSTLTIQPSSSGIAYVDYPNAQGKSQPVVGTTTSNANYNPVTTISLLSTASGDSSSTIEYQSGTNPIAKHSA